MTAAQELNANEYYSPNRRHMTAAGVNGAPTLHRRHRLFGCGKFTMPARCPDAAAAGARGYKLAVPVRLTGSFRWPAIGSDGYTFTSPKYPGLLYNGSVEQMVMRRFNPFQIMLPIDSTAFDGLTHGIRAHYSANAKAVDVF